MKWQTFPKSTGERSGLRARSRIAFVTLAEVAKMIGGGWDGARSQRLFLYDRRQTNASQRVRHFCAIRRGCAGWRTFGTAAWNRGGWNDLSAARGVLLGKWHGRKMELIEGGKYNNGLSPAL